VPLVPPRLYGIQPNIKQNDALECAELQDGERRKGRGINCFALVSAVVRYTAGVSKRIKRPLLYY